MTPQIPDTIGRYEIQKPIGKGGMGLLYLARDPRIDRLVAIKVLRVDDDDMRQRFEREARMIGRFQHPNIVTVYDVGTYDDQPFIAMEYIPGETLAERIAKQDPLPLKRRLALITELCAGLAYAHQRGVIHRDIKPANLIIHQESGQLKILDFGIAHGTTGTGLTQLGALIGTPRYMAPEQLSGREVDQRCDIFAVGLVLYETLSYRPAFPGDQGPLVAYRIMHESPHPLDDIDERLDKDLIAIVTRALEKLPGRRYQDLTAMGVDLERVCGRLDAHTLDTTVHVALAGMGAGPPRIGIDREQVRRRREAQLRSHFDNAHKALSTSDYRLALEAAEEAALLSPDDPRVEQLLDKLHRAQEEDQVDGWLTAARAALVDDNLTGAEALASQALELRPAHSGASAIKDEVRQTRATRAEEAERTRAIADMLDRARTALGSGATQSALDAATEILSRSPRHAEAAALEREAEAAALEREVVQPPEPVRPPDAGPTRTFLRTTDEDDETRPMIRWVGVAAGATAVVAVGIWIAAGGFGSTDTPTRTRPVVSQPVVGPTSLPEPTSDRDTPSADSEEWASFQRAMTQQHAAALDLDVSTDLTPAEKVNAWQRFLLDFAGQNPLTEEDDRLRSYADGRIVFWDAQPEPIAAADPPAVPAPPEPAGPDAEAVRVALERAEQLLDAADFDLAETAFETVLGLDPGNPAARDGAARTTRAVQIRDGVQRAERLFAEGDVTGAAIAFEAVLVLDPANVTAQSGADAARQRAQSDADIQRADSAFARGNFDEAALAYDAALAVDPTNAAARDGLDRVRPPTNPTAGQTWTAPVDGREMRWVPPGTFQMGSPSTETDRDPDELQHMVRLSTGYWVDTAEVTYREFQRFVLDNPAWSKDGIDRRFHDGNYLADWDSDEIPAGKADQPVVNVSWHAARAYAAWVGKRLLTEAEWEYACRAGAATAFWWGDSFDPRRAGTAPANAAQRTNRWGLADMIGGVWEWTASVYQEYPYRATDGRENTGGAGQRVVRGGATVNDPRMLRIANRNRDLPERSSDLVGFRCAR